MRVRGSRRSKSVNKNPSSDFGKRRKVKVGSQEYLDETELDCTKCGETIFNLLSDVGKVTCSRCTMQLAIAQEKQDKERDEALKMHRKVGRPKKSENPKPKKKR